MNDVIVNRVSESALSTIDLEQFYPGEEVRLFDLKDYLFMNLILKEKDFREALKNTDWEVYSGKIVAVTCTADAIIPMWAYMLVATYLQPVAANVVYGNQAQALDDAPQHDSSPLLSCGESIVANGFRERHCTAARARMIRA